MSTDRPSPWVDAALAAVLLAIDPASMGGVVLRARAGPVRERWLEQLRALLPPSTPWRRMPLHIADTRLLGGLDLAATLKSGRPVVERGLLAEVHGGLLLIPMAERLPPAVAGRLAIVVDRGQVAVERDGIGARDAARFGIVAMDEGEDDDEQPPSALMERLGLHVDLSAVSHRAVDEPWFTAAEVVAARARLASVSASREVIEAVCATALALGIGSLRAPLLALHAARAAAALDGRDTVTPDDVALAARLVLAPRATMLPALEADEEDATGQTADDAEPSPPQPGQPPETRAEDALVDEAPPDEERDESAGERPLDEVVLASAQAAIPAGLLARLGAGQGARARARSSGKSGALHHGLLRGRPAGVRRGEPRAGARLNVVETLRAAAPWQPLRRQQAGSDTGARIMVRREDFRVTRFKQRRETTTIFAVDASGSSALHRLAEAKGAIELLLADCYVRRDRVALIAFRGSGAELLLPPTRSLVRTKRELARLPGGGGTPLAAGIDAALTVADAVVRRGGTPVVVVLTDGRANVGRSGAAGREQAEQDALAAAQALRGAAVTSLLVDTSHHPQPKARRLAEAMGGTYLPLPFADAAALTQAVEVTAGLRPVAAG